MIATIRNRLGRYFLAGVLAILPLAITVGIAIWVAGWVTRIIGPGTTLGGALTRIGVGVAPNTALAYIVGWVFVLAVIFLLGVLVEAGARRYLERWFEGTLRRVPLMGGVYGTAKQLVGMLGRKRDSDLSGMRVVHCVFGRETGAAFLALLVTPEHFEINGVSYHAILIPTAPVPVGGSLMFVPAASVHPADITIEAFMSIYVSMGVSAPQFLLKTASA